MGKCNIVKVGDKFIAKPDVEVTVVEYHSAMEIVVEDAVGNSRLVNAYQLKKGELTWLTKLGKIRKNSRGKVDLRVNNSGNVRRPSPKVGERYLSNKDGWYEIIEIKSYKDMTIKFEDSGAVKSGVYCCHAYTGKVADITKNLSSRSLLHKEFPVGGRHTSETYGDFTVLEYVDSCTVNLLWHETGNTELSVSAERLRSGSARDTPEYNKLYNYLSPKEGQHYVYLARLSGEIIYVGSGYAKRYLHCRNGRSHNKELNRLYFTGTEVEVVIHKDGLSKEHSLGMEKHLIELLEPYCNKQRYNLSLH